MYELYRCKARIGYKFFNSRKMVVFDEDQIASIDLKLNWDANFRDLNGETMDSKLMLYATPQNTCSVSLKDPHLTGLAWPSLYDVAGQTLSDSFYVPGIGVALRECEAGETPGKDACARYEEFNYDTFAAKGFDGEVIEDSSAGSQYSPPMLLISLWYETPNGYTFGTDYIYQVTGVSVSHGKNYPTVDLAGSGNYGVVFQDSVLNMAIGDKDNAEFSITEIVERLGFEPVFCKANYSEPRKLDRKIALRGVTANQGLSKIVKEMLGGDLVSLPTQDNFKKLHICTRADGASGRKVFYLGKPLYESYDINAQFDPTFWSQNNERFGSNNLLPGGAQSTYKLEELSEKDVVSEIYINTKFNPLKDDKYSGDTYTLSTTPTVSGTWKDYGSDNSIYYTANATKQYFINVQPDRKVSFLEETKRNSWYVGSWSPKKALAPIRGALVSNSKGAAVIKSDIFFYIKGLNTLQVYVFPIYCEIKQITLHSTDKTLKVSRAETLGDTGDTHLMRFYILNSGAKVFIDIPTLIKYAIEENALNSTVAAQNATTASGRAPTGTTSGDATSTIAKKITIGQLTALKELIISGESASNRSEAANHRTKGASTIKALTGTAGANMTIGQLMTQQANNKIYAAGWPQIIPPTLKKATAGMDVNALKYNEATQDQLFLWLIQYKRPQIYSYLIGSNDNLQEAAQALAREWASIGLSYDEAPANEIAASGVHTVTADHKRKRKAGTSLYSGVNGNKAHISPSRAQQVLKSIRNKISPRGTGDGDVSASSGSSTEAKPTGYVWPMTGTVTSGIGWRWGRMHKGIDIAGPVGTPVVAAAAGEVTVAKYMPGPAGDTTTGGYGNVVYIKHSNGQTTRYAHLSAVNVKVGQVVAQNQLIGKCGNTGNSTGPHLHFEIRDTKDGHTEFSRKSSGQVTANTPIDTAFDSSGVRNDGVIAGQSNGSALSTGEQRGVMASNPVPKSGFTISTQFKGMPRALRIVPYFTTLSFLTTYSGWLSSGRSDDIDPQVWIPEGLFRNWIIYSVSFSWKNADLRINIEGSSPVGASTTDSVPPWEKYQEWLKKNGYRETYRDYIRAFGDLCWENDAGVSSCEDPSLAEEVFAQMQGTQQAIDNTTSTAPTSVSTQEGLCNVDIGKIGITSQDYQDLLKMIIAEAYGEGIMGMALVSRSILNRWIVNRETKGANPYGKGSNGKTLRDVIFAKGYSGGYEYSPLQDKNFYKARSAEQLAEAAKAFQLGFNTTYLASRGVSQAGLKATSFRVKSLSADSTWKGGVYTYQNHKFSQDNGGINKDMSALFTKYYGKCSAPSATTPTTTQTSSGYVTAKANMGNWKANPNKPVETIFVLAAGHQSDPETGAAGSQSAKRIYKGGRGIPSTIESAMTRRALPIFVQVGKAAGFDVRSFTAQTWGRGGDPAARSTEWNRFIANSEGKGNNYYAVELHFDAYDPPKYPGYSGVLSPTDPNKISKIDDALGRVFGKFDNKAGLNNRGGSIFEIGSANPYITDAFLRGENKGDFSVFDAEMRNIANKFWSTIKNVR